MESKLKSLEKHMESLKQSKSQLVATLEMEKAKAEAVQEELDRYKNLIKHTCNYVSIVTVDISIKCIVHCWHVYVYYFSISTGIAYLQYISLLLRERAKHGSLKNSYTHALTEARKEKVVCFIHSWLVCKNELFWIATKNLSLIFLMPRHLTETVHQIIRPYLMFQNSFNYMRVCVNTNLLLMKVC